MSIISDQGKIDLAVVGATGQVGRQMLSILDERNFPIKNLRLFSSARSAGTTITYRGIEVLVEDLTVQNAASLNDLDLAIFSAGGDASRNFAPIFEAAGVIVIDNSSAWRKDETIPLVVSEVNPGDLDAVFEGGRKIIANPNCTTMAAMPVLKPLHDQFKMIRLQVATYQAVSGGGVAGVEALATETESAVKQDFRKLAIDGQSVQFPRPEKFKETIAFNALPYAGDLVDDGLFETDEEQKLRHESRKILHAPQLLVSGTCVRVPVFSGHSLVVHTQFANEVDVQEAYKILSETPGVVVQDIPTPLKAAGTDPSIVGRIRQDNALDNPKTGLILFICSDNLRKGAALNTIQIAELLIDRIVDQKGRE
jgi:aspartate-semialdehyde dehydrogenase